MLAMRRESDNNISGANNNPHPNGYAIPSSSAESSLAHLNYYNSAGYGGYQHNSKFRYLGICNIESPIQN